MKKENDYHNELKEMDERILNFENAIKNLESSLHFLKTIDSAINELKDKTIGLKREYGFLKEKLSGRMEVHLCK
jgi:predicted RNase H-like nuclease (RuvC/YqgF family)